MAATIPAVQRAIAVHTADLSPVRGYRSRKGRTWPGYAPVAPKRPDTTRAVPMADRVAEGTYPMPATMADVRTFPAFTTMTAARAATIIASYVRSGALRPNRAAALTLSVQERTVVRAR